MTFEGQLRYSKFPDSSRSILNELPTVLMRTTGTMATWTYTTLNILKIRHAMKTIIVALLLLSTLFDCIARGDAPQLPSALNSQKIAALQVKQSSVQSRGRVLRIEIDKADVEADLFHVPPIGWPKILGKVVERYITVGTRFDYAEALLRSAGFGVVTDTTHVPSRPNEHHGTVSATLKLHTYWMGYSGVVINLYPQSKDDYTIIGKVEVMYFGQSL